MESVPSSTPKQTLLLPQPPELSPRWFRATDIPKRDDTPFKFRSPSNVPKPAAQWAPLSMRDSIAIEAIYQQLVKKSSTKSSSRNINGLSPTRSKERSEPSRENCIIGGEDNLYEIDVGNREIYPVFWAGPTYDIRRGTWFSLSGIGSTYQPCDENLSRQLEDGYRKYTPWIPANTAGTPAVPKSMSSTEDISTSSPRPDTRWALFGPYMNQYVVYASSSSAWLQSDMLTSKFTRAVTNSSGLKLIRSWSEVCKLSAKVRSSNILKAAKSSGKPDQSPVVGGAALEGGQVLDTPLATDTEGALLEDIIEEDDDSDRQVDHLVFVIHGIGQKLSERVDAVNFPHDCNTLRQAIKTSAKQFQDQAALLKTSEPHKIPRGSGVQVLPIQWRQKIDFGMRKEEEDNPGEDSELSLEDISLDGIPSIRMLVSDVIIDVLLYLTPKYRQEMIRQVTSELNQVYHKYLERNPTFSGKISLYGHSLGSILAYDIVSHQHMARPSTSSKHTKVAGHEVDISDLLEKTLQGGGVAGLIESNDTLEYELLEFRVNALFAVGSPIGLFLLLRGNRIGAYSDIETSLTDSRTSRPDVKSMYNIFHPFDPVAHRIEPLVTKSLSSLKPVPIPYTKGGLTKTINGIQDLGTDIVERGRSIIETVRLGLFSSFSTTAGMAIGYRHSSTESRGPAVSIPMSEMGTTSGSQPSGGDGVGKAVKAADQNSDIRSLNPNGRLDYALQEGVLENPYLSSLGVHMSYWDDSDCSMFILKELYCITSIPIARCAQPESTDTSSTVTK
ncbi:hypothetical protein BASA60_008753 [Batrachochytrium salamandrivorans]|nr:hypothetical protein BASA60_008753 [Batrachochytrium salamandrivorans]